ELGYRPGDLPPKLCLAAEVPGWPADRECEQPGAQYLDARAELLYGTDHLLEFPDLAVVGLAGHHARRVPGRAAHGKHAPVTVLPRRPVLACSWSAGSGAAVTAPSGPGSHSQRACDRDQPPRPSVTTWARRSRSRPCPAPIPAHSWAVMRSLTCAPSQSPATS